MRSLALTRRFVREEESGIIPPIKDTDLMLATPMVTLLYQWGKFL
jgi:hypothetical protein